MAGERLAGRVALVTGAARGIGEAVARAFVAEGGFVFVSDIDERGARAVAASLGDAAAALRLDVREEAAWEAAMRAVLARGPLDVLVNNAGITGLEGGEPGDPERASLAQWRAVQAVNSDGVFLGCRAAIRAMRPRGCGAIINISSRSGLVGVPAAAAYAASKAAVRNHTRSVALYCAEQGLAIRCNAVLPGAILTPMWEPMLGEGMAREEALRELVAEVPVRRFGAPAEVAALCVMLASEEAAYMTGAELVLDGGLTAGTAVRPAQRSSG
jgi:NAD(P)-dependent dehydrogenase (short-subunit alcohol dehydrogenase family)